MITVVMATYNHAGYIESALESLRNQTLSSREFEVIVVNDGSTDATPSLLTKYEGWIKRIDQTNQGLVAACNRGLAAASGKYFARLDSDDFVDNAWLETLEETFENHPEAACIFPDLVEITEGTRQQVSLNAEDIYTLQACGPMFRTDLLREIGGFRPFYWEEYDLYLRLKAKGSFIHVARPLYMYRKHQQNMTANRDRRIEGWRQLASEWGIETLKAAGHCREMEEALRGR